MTDASQTITKRAPSPPPMPAYLSEMMSVVRIVEVLEHGLHFNKARDEARLVIDEGVQAFLIRAAKAAAADHIDAKVCHLWRTIPPRRG